jgi:AraC-like DNA-binding protein
VDVVLLDVRMPGLSGWEVFDRLCQMDARRPRVIFLTCINESAPAVEALQRGADGWIVKPWDEGALRTQLRGLLALARGIVVRGGDPGVRATIGVLAAARCAAPAAYQTGAFPPPAAPGVPVVDANGARTEAGLVAVLSQPPIALTGLSEAIGATLHRVAMQVSRWNVGSLAAAAGLSANHFSERFRREVGLPLHAHLVRVRVEVAKQRLAEPGRLSLERLAEEVGFCHASHLARVFKDVARQPPGLYRRNMQRDRWNVH